MFVRVPSFELVGLWMLPRNWSFVSSSCEALASAEVRVFARGGNSPFKNSLIANSSDGLTTLCFTKRSNLLLGKRAFIGTIWVCIRRVEHFQLTFANRSKQIEYFGSDISFLHLITWNVPSLLAEGSEASLLRILNWMR